MKKLLIGILLTASVFSITSCGSSNQFEQYNSAMKAFNEAPSSKLAISNTIVSTPAGEDVQTSKITATISEVLVSDGVYDNAMKINVASASTSSDIETYFHDGFSYSNNIVQSSKTKENASTYVEYKNQLGANFIYDLTSGDIDSSSSKKVDDGVELTFKIGKDSNAAKNLYKTDIDTFSTVYKIPVDSLNPTFDDVAYTVTLGKKDVLVSTNVKYSYSIVVNGTKIGFNFDTNATVEQIGDVTIDFPLDLDTYQDITSLIAPDVSNQTNTEEAAPMPSESASLENETSLPEDGESESEAAPSSPVAENAMPSASNSVAVEEVPTVDLGETFTIDEGPAVGEVQN